jgi:predicted DNA-binding protein YlxM (UPF0122 family)
MKKYRSHDSGGAFLERINYTKPSELKALIKYVLISDNSGGDSSELCLLADLKTILGLYDTSKSLKILTSKQKTVIVEHLVNDRIQAELAESLNITQQGVSILLNSALKRIKNYINDGELKWMPWTDEEKTKLMDEYGKVHTYKLSAELGKPISRVISMYHFLKNKEREERDKDEPKLERTGGPS